MSIIINGKTLNEYIKAQKWSRCSLPAMCMIHLMPSLSHAVLYAAMSLMLPNLKLHHLLSVLLIHPKMIMQL